MNLSLNIKSVAAIAFCLCLGLIPLGCSQTTPANSGGDTQSSDTGGVTGTATAGDCQSLAQDLEQNLCGQCHGVTASAGPKVGKSTATTSFLFSSGHPGSSAIQSAGVSSQEWDAWASLCSNI